MYTHILFDLDGTLTDSGEGIINSFNYALKKFNIDVKDLSSLRKVIGPPLKDSFIDFYNFNENNVDEAVSYYREYFKAKGMFENKVYHGIPILLSSLKEKGFHLVVATSKPTVFSNEILKHFNLYDYFDGVFGSTLDGTLCKKEDIIKYAINELNIKNNNAIMIGDREHDMIGASRNNINSIGVTYGFGSSEELKNAGASYVVDAVDELLQKIVLLNR
ncbi:MULTISPECIES: HAD family hydrolase [Clostridium]|uniref:HAD family hydrolase n=1 Tax=Clostridium TaxID=1485 RepID=UPI00082400B8|nr:MULTISPECIES: HAD family hydrolase [Clostridium]PJI07936.1 phosphoglycolate phosphatase [Clostridium sp. CT7]